MLLKIWIALFLFEFSNGQVTFPDQTTTTTSKPSNTLQTSTTTEAPTSSTAPPTTTVAPTTTTSPPPPTTTTSPPPPTTTTELITTLAPTITFAPTTTTVVTVVTTTVPTTTTTVVTTTTTASPNVTICAAVNQCMDIGGIPIINMTGKMDVRVNNKGEAYNSTVGSNEQLTTPLNPGIPLVIPSQSSCPSNLTERCNIPTGLKCGTAFKPVSNYPDPGYPYIQYPWQGLVMRNDPIDKLTVYASGALITHKDFLTVANKVVQFAATPSALLVRLGDSNLLSSTKPFTPQEYQVSDVIVHSYFNPNTLEYDGAILRLATFVPLGQLPSIGVACLPKDDLSYTPINCMVAGFGKSSKDGNRNFQIQEVSQPIIDPAQCETRIRAEIGSYYHNADANLCAGGEIDKSNCDGDAGNPLVCNITGQWYVVGLASWAPAGQDCGVKPIPELYFNVATQGPWIQYVTSGLGKKFSTTANPLNGGLKTSTTKGNANANSNPTFTTPILGGATSQGTTTTTRRRMNAITTTSGRPTTVQGSLETSSTDGPIVTRMGGQTTKKADQGTKTTNKATGKTSTKARGSGGTSKKTTPKVTTTTKPKSG